MLLFSAENKVLEKAYELSHFEGSFKEAVAGRWPDGDGGYAQQLFMESAGNRCNEHAILTSLKNKANKRVSSATKGLMTYSKNNLGNSRYAVKKVTFTSGDNLKEILRDPKIWRFVGPWESSSEADNQTWYYKTFVPDTYTRVFRDSWFEWGGLVTGEVKSDVAAISKATEARAFLHALQGLSYKPYAGALIMTPNEAQLQSLHAENGIIDVKRKRYILTTGDSPYEKRVNPSAYETLFNDLVLYLWNTFYNE